MQIHLNEVHALQPLIHELLCDNFPSYNIISSRPADGQPDERIQFGQADIGGFKLKTDSGGNTYGQCQQYYVTQVLALREAASPILRHSCTPMLWCELSCATFRICAAAFVGNCFAFEPLTPALHLYGINNPDHMLTLARCCSALRQTLAQLARLYNDVGLQQGQSEHLKHASPSVPYHISHLYPGAEGHADHAPHAAGIPRAATTALHPSRCQANSSGFRQRWTCSSCCMGRCWPRTKAGEFRSACLPLLACNLHLPFLHCF